MHAPPTPSRRLAHSPALPCRRPCSLADDGYTSLILAACGGNIELVKFFINRGASITERNGNGDTALLLAAYCGNRDLVDWLLHNGSSLAEKNDTGMGALISAANGAENSTLFDIMFFGTITSRHSQPHRHTHARCGMCFTRCPCVPGVDRCLQSDAVSNARGGDAGGDVEVVELLLERIAKGGDDCGDGLEKTDEGGYTPLLLAAQRGHLEVVKVLAQFGANVKAETAIHRNTAASLALDFVEVTQYLQVKPAPRTSPRTSPVPAPYQSPYQPPYQPRTPPSVLPYACPPCHTLSPPPHPQPCHRPSAAHCTNHPHARTTQPADHRELAADADCR